MAGKKPTAKEKVAALVAGMADKFAAALEEGAANPANWQPPWHSSGMSGWPSNPATGKTYRGMNQFLLMLGGGGGWATYKQWESIGGQVRKGEKSTSVLRPCTIRKEDENDPSKVGVFTIYTTYPVFHQSQQEGWRPAEIVMPAQEDDPCPAFDSWQAGVLQHMGVGYREVVGDRAYYSPAKDEVVLPLREQFTTLSGYRATFAHEFGHATGHKSRLDRHEGGMVFGSPEYAAEEMVAELTAASVGAHLDMCTELRDDHRDYLASWARALRDDPNYLSTAVKAASKASTWLLQWADVKDGSVPAEEAVA